jgi:hypothetical protein
MLLSGIVSFIWYAGISRSFQRGFRIRPDLIVGASIAIQIFTWRSFEGVDRWPDSNATVGIATFAVAALMTFAIGIRVVTSATPICETDDLSLLARIDSNGRHSSTNPVSTSTQRYSALWTV